MRYELTDAVLCCAMCVAGFDVFFLLFNIPKCVSVLFCFCITFFQTENVRVNGQIISSQILFMYTRFSYELVHYIHCILYKS